MTSHLPRARVQDIDQTAEQGVTGDRVTMGPFGPGFFPGQTVRMVDVLGAGPMMVLIDACAILGISNARQAAKSLPNDQMSKASIPTAKGDRLVTVATEAAIKELIARTKLRQAAPYRTAVIIDDTDPATGSNTFGLLQRVVISGFTSRDYHGHTVRLAITNAGFWTVYEDVIHILDLKNPSMVATRLAPDEKGMGVQVSDIHLADIAYPNAISKEVLLINEAGLNQLVLQSNRPEADAIRRWLTHEVMPSIRRTGSYTSGVSDSKPTSPHEHRQPGSIRSIHGPRLQTRWFRGLPHGFHATDSALWVDEFELAEILSADRSVEPNRIPDRHRAIYVERCSEDQIDRAIPVISVEGAIHRHRRDLRPATQALLLWLQHAAPTIIEGRVIPANVRWIDDQTNNTVLIEPEIILQNTLLNIRINEISFTNQGQVQINTVKALSALRNIEKKITEEKTEDLDEWIHVAGHMDEWINTYRSKKLVIDIINSLLDIWLGNTVNTTLPTSNPMSAIVERHFERSAINNWLFEKGFALLKVVELQAWKPDQPASTIVEPGFPDEPS